MATSRPIRLKPRSKYHAVKTTVDGITFASKKEAKRYGELKLLERAGDLRALRLQPRYALVPLRLEKRALRNINDGPILNSRVPVAFYVADFEYEESDRGYGGIKWQLVVEDTKGMKTETYLLKKRWFEAQYDIAIREL